MVGDLENIIKNIILAKFNKKYKIVIDIEKNKIQPKQMPHNIIKIIDKYNKEKNIIKCYVDSVRDCINEINLRNLSSLCYLESKLIERTINVNDFRSFLLHNKGLYDKYDIYCLIILVILLYEDYKILLHKISKHSGITIDEEIIAKCLNILYNLKSINENQNSEFDENQNSKFDEKNSLIEDYFSFGKVNKIDYNSLNIPYVHSLKQCQSLISYDKLMNSKNKFEHQDKYPIIKDNIYILYIDGNITTNDLLYVDKLCNTYKRRILLGGMSFINIMEYVRDIFN